MKSQISAIQAVEKIKDGMTIMVAGFLSSGSALSVLKALSASDVKNLTLICNDTTFPDKGHGELFTLKKVKKVITTYLGANPISQLQYENNEIEVEFFPQGTLIEKIRCGGYGLGGVLTPTGIGTLVENGKQKINLDGKDFLLETALRADIALIGATRADLAGNLYYEGTTRNYNQMMAMAANLVIAETEEILPENQFIKPEDVHTQGILVDFLVSNQN
ncbi:MAG: CoA transferase subunit A [Prevotellaceae bacterium]|jgi:acetate CoA/acetoacetate CoA-transferase alpha subunit|nr:CoA transferase subunit A [Prevotellaceae bacterium]